MRLVQGILPTKLTNSSQYYGPDYELDVRSSNMENANSKDYLEKIKIQVIENLKKTAHAPSVQMTDIPRTTLTGGTEDDDHELDDMDEDDNKDTRNTKRRWDQRITRDDELEESEDEEEAHANGVRPQDGQTKRRNIMDYQNVNAAASDVDMDSGMASPVAVEVDDLVTAKAIEANAEVIAEIMEEKTLHPAAAETREAGPSNAASRAPSPMPTVIDVDGDTEMGDEVPEPESVSEFVTGSMVVPQSPKMSVTPATEDALKTVKAEVKQEVEAERSEKDIAGEVAAETAKAAEA
jgi:histone deacetylase 1/2